MYQDREQEKSLTNHSYVNHLHLVPERDVSIGPFILLRQNQRATAFDA